VAARIECLQFLNLPLSSGPPGRAAVLDIVAKVL